MPGSLLSRQLVNDLLDRIIQEPAADTTDVLRKAIHAKALTAARYGQEEIDNVLATIRDIHLPNLRNIAGTYKGKPVRLEPTFVSAAYGLQGRLDALIEDRRQKDLKDIFELKSGKAPKGDQVWINNQVQVVCYHLLLRSVFGDRRHGTSAVFYSSSPALPLRNVAPNAHFEAEVQFVRNMIVRGIFDLAKNNLWILQRLHPQKIGTVPPSKWIPCGAWKKPGEMPANSGRPGTVPISLS
ncbi:MAG: PD-(D/E)XK nuclease family protein [Saprospiraceae bacterium]|nr:PD-(D/E)XK nuclease family protein [Saprospiraceae bacterium]